MDNLWVADPVCYSHGGSACVRRHLRCDIVEGHRYADDEPSWYPGAGRYARSTSPDVSGAHPTGNPYDTGVHDRPNGAFRLPEQRPESSPYAAGGDPYLSTGSHARAAGAEPPAAYDSVRVPVRGPEYPTITPAKEPPASPAAARSGPARSGPASPGPAGAGLMPAERGRAYQPRRPVSSVLVAAGMAVLMIPVIRLLLDQTFAGTPTARGIVPAVLVTLGFALTGTGLFAVARGGPVDRESWVRAPMAYLPVGLIVLLAAGLAVA